MKHCISFFLRRTGHFFEDPSGMIIKFMIRYCPQVVPDKQYIQYVWAQKMDYPLDLDNPRSFNEKLQWLKLYDHNPLYTTLVDKIAVKEWVANRIGEQYIIPTLAVYRSVDEIDMNILPNQFVLKCTHDSGSIAICEDKTTFDFASAKTVLNRGLKRNFYYMGREWPYKNVPPRILVEKYMKDGTSDSLIDYKFYCFDGQPKFLYVSYGLAEHSTAFINYVTLDWKKAPFRRPDFWEFEELPAKPENFELMMGLAKELSKGIPFLRVDLYEINKKVYFSELTFSPGCGFTPFVPQEWDYRCGELLELPVKK